MDLVLIIEVESLNALKALLQVRLDSLGLLGFGQDFKQLLIGEEVEAWEERSLGLKVGIQALLDHV